MKNNVGKIDRVLRGAAALLILLLYFAGVIKDQSAIILGVIAIMLLFTSFTSFCPCYVRLKINTKKNNN
jgi:Inner membrane protein YgaP-like, transmembrane domain